jgi:hypothetical protein
MGASHKLLDTMRGDVESSSLVCFVEADLRWRNKQKPDTKERLVYD